MPDPAIAFASIAAVGARYRDGSLSPIEVTGLCLERIAAHDPELNAFLSVLNRRRSIRQRPPRPSSERVAIAARCTGSRWRSRT